MSNPKTINSIRALARCLKRNEKAVRSWLKDDRWTFRRKPPWKSSELAAMDVWRLTNLEQQPDVDTGGALRGLSTERQAKIELCIERTAKVRLERELLAGKYLKRDDVHADLLSRAGEARRTLESITSLAPRLVGRDENEIRRLLTDNVNLVCEVLSKGARQ